MDLPPQLNLILRHYSQSVDFRQIEVKSTRPGFSGAHVWKIVTSDATFALRRWPTGGALSPVRIRGLHQLLKDVSRHGVDLVAVPLSTDAGDTLFLSHDDLSSWQLEPWMPGTADFHSRPSDRRLQTAMQALARWHQAAARFTPREEHRAWFGSLAAAPSPAIAERSRYLTAVTPRQIAELRRAIKQPPSAAVGDICEELLRQVERLQPRLLAELQASQQLHFTLQPCLRDIWHDHVLFTGDEVTGLIDASACRTENVAADLSRLIGSLVEDDRAGWNKSLDVYQQLRPLGVHEIALVGVLDRSGVVLGAWTWLEWLLLSPRSFPDWKQVQNRLEYFRRRLIAMDS